MWSEQLLGMRGYFYKSELITMNILEEDAHRISHIFSCPLGHFPIKYLGVSLHFSKLRRGHTTFSG